MKAIILAAGRGSRMGLATENKPKCMASYNNKLIIDYKIETFITCGITDIVIVNGYKKNVLESYLGDSEVRFVANDKYNSTNMVYSLFCAEHEMDGDLTISYGDIIYTDKVLNQITQNKSDIVVAVDKNWRELWALRMEDPLKDAETLKMDANCNIVELGKKPSSYGEIEGQFIGLIKISRSAIKQIRKFYHSLDKSATYDDMEFNNMYMTQFIQLIIEELMPVKAELISGGWLEFDSFRDLEIYERNLICL